MASPLTAAAQGDFGLLDGEINNECVSVVAASIWNVDDPHSELPGTLMRSTWISATVEASMFWIHELPNLFASLARFSDRDVVPAVVPESPPIRKSRRPS